MAVTETPPETVAAASESDASPPHAQPTGLAGVLGTGDHKVIGRLYIVASLVFGALVLTLGEAFAVESIKPETYNVFSSSNGYQFFTLARLGPIFLLALPLIIGVALVVVPLQVGARSVAFPRAAAASFWGWLLGSALLVASYLIEGGPGGTSKTGINLWIAAMGLIVLSLLLAAICLATTVLALRTTGLNLSRVPLFAWSILVSSILWLLTLPVLFGLIVLMYVDHRSAGSLLVGAPNAIYPSLVWVLRNPQVYVVAIPVLGLVADVIVTMSHARLKNRSVFQTAIGAFGVLSFGAFLAFPSQTALETPLVVAMAVLAVAPLLAVASAAADGLRGSFKLNASVLYAVSAFLVLLLGVIAGAIGSVPGILDAPADSTVSTNIFFLGVGNAVVIATVIAGLGGLHFWATKVGRQSADEKLGSIAPLLLLVGAVVAVVPDLVSGLAGKDLEIGGTYTGGIPALNVLVTVGLVIVGVGLLASLISLLPLLKRTDDDVPADPWEGQTLEWLTASPPPLANFTDDLAVVTSAEPLFDLREEK